MISKEIPNLFNDKQSEIETTIKKWKEENKEEQNLYNKNANSLLQNLLTNEAINLKEILLNDEEKELKAIKSDFGSVIYDYYRINKASDEETQSLLKGRAFDLKEAKDLIHKRVKKTFDYKFNRLKDFFKDLETIPKISVKGKQILRLPNCKNLEGEKSRFRTLFIDLIRDPYPTINKNYKIEYLNKLYIQAFNLKESKKYPGLKYLKAYILVCFYDLVYGVSILTDQISYEDAEKIICMKKK
jgi:hypothetical protein